ncbi:GMC family oxidoreductase [Fibrella aquatica]|uniref:GMC family oxidoreductase n=1 Tax=Fibrella aquatica TaxID=3242487 RepID=UPI00351F913F
MSFDYIIVGAGSAGCVLANRLSADPAVTVLLLEAGAPDKKREIHIPAGYAKLNRTSVDWAYYTETQEHVDGRRMFLPRGKTLGGSSSTNAMAYVRGNRADYNAWAAAGNTGWDFETVLPYFLRSECNEQISQLDSRYHGIDGPMNVTYATRFKTPLADAFVEACKQHGIPENHDMNGAEQEGAGLLQFTIKNGKRHSTAGAFLKPVLNRPNLTIRTHAHTQRIVVKDGRAVGVELTTGKSLTETVMARREIILAAGSFNSPQLLMLSGIGPADELRRHHIDLKLDLPGVGQNLQDHLFVGVSSLANQLVGVNHWLNPANQLKGMWQYVTAKKGPFTISPLEANAFVRTSNTLTQPDLQLHFAPIHIGDDYKADFYNPDTYPKKADGWSILPTLLQPTSRGYVGLRSANPLEAPVIQPNFLSTQKDYDLLLTGTKLALDLNRSVAFSPWRERALIPADNSSDEALMAHIRKIVETVYHPVGTCRMGNDEGAVVDAQLRVRGIQGLRVVDASIMPTIVSGNTNAPVIMIAERAADLILGRTGV